MTCNGITGGIHGRNDASGVDWGASSFRSDDTKKKTIEEDTGLKAHQSPGFHVPGDGKSIIQ